MIFLKAFKEKALRHIAYYEKRLKEYENIFYNNPLFRQRTEGVGVLTREDAVKLGVTGSVSEGFWCLL